MRRLAATMAAVLALAACGTAQEEQMGTTTWDLRTSHRAADVDWPRDLDGDRHTIDARSADVRVLLPGGLDFDDAHRVFATLALGEEAGEDGQGRLGSVTANFPEEDIDAALARAERYAEAWDADIANLREAAQPGGGIAHSRPVDLPGGGTGSVSIRARGDGTGYVFLGVVWDG